MVVSEEGIIIHNLWKCFGAVQVLQGLNLHVKNGETLVILGRSGVGKSVLLRHIMALVSPDQGEIRVNGINLGKLKGQKLYQTLRHMGMLFQGAALFDSMNIEENVGFYLDQHGNPATQKPYTKKEIEDKVQEALEMVGLQSIQKKMPSELSGGMRKRVALARLIVYRPKILLYDEPTTGLDPITAMQINQLILKTQNELKATSIVVTHDITSALVVGDRLGLHKEGKLFYVSDPETFLKVEDPTIEFLRKTLSQDPRKFKQEML